MRDYTGCTLVFLVDEEDLGDRGIDSGGTVKAGERWVYTHRTDSGRRVWENRERVETYSFTPEEIERMVTCGIATLMCATSPTTSGGAPATPVATPPPAPVSVFSTMPEEFRLLVEGCPDKPATGAFMLRLFKTLPPEPLPTTTDAWKVWIETRPPCTGTFTNPAPRIATITPTRTVTPPRASYSIDYTTDETQYSTVSREQGVTISRRIDVPEDVLQEAAEADDVDIITAWIEDNWNDGDEMHTDWGDSDDTDERVTDTEMNSVDVSSRDAQRLLARYLEDHPQETEDEDEDEE